MNLAGVEIAWELTAEIAMRRRNHSRLMRPRSGRHKRAAKIAKLIEARGVFGEAWRSANDCVEVSFRSITEK
jgi:hypothetical protein